MVKPRDPTLVSTHRQHVTDGRTDGHAAYRKVAL